MIQLFFCVMVISGIERGEMYRGCGNMSDELDHSEQTDGMVTAEVRSCMHT